MIQTFEDLQENLLKLLEEGDLTNLKLHKRYHSLPNMSLQLISAGEAPQKTADLMAQVFSYLRENRPIPVKEAIPSVAFTEIQDLADIPAAESTKSGVMTPVIMEASSIGSLLPVALTLLIVQPQSDAAYVLKECKLIVWDEATMAHKGRVETLDKTLQDIRSSNHLMIGMTVLLTGDFRQTLPVVPRGTRVDKGNPEAEDFSNLLLQIGNGDLHEDDDRKVNISNNLCAVVKDLKSLSEQIYPNLNTKKKAKTID
ncbi:hypothetical protein QTP88_029475 [Uroleucon formosanum]